MRHALVLTILAAAGCLEPDLPVTNYYQAPNPTVLPPLDPASTEAAARVDAVGRRVLAANPEIGAKPLFRTIGAPQPEVFHRGTTDVFITEALVKKCDTDDQLAAVLALELGKMVRERESLAPSQVRTGNPLPPIDTRLGNDDRFGGTPDRTDVKELVDYDIERRRHRKPNQADYDAEARHQRRPLALPDPNALALAYLKNMGVTPQALAEAEPALREAKANAGLERQITRPAPVAEKPAVSGP